MANNLVDNLARVNREGKTREREREGAREREGGGRVHFCVEVNYASVCECVPALLKVLIGVPIY